MIQGDFRKKLLSMIESKKEELESLKQKKMAIQSQIRAIEEDLGELATSLAVHDRLMGISKDLTDKFDSIQTQRFTVADYCFQLMKEGGGNARVLDLMRNLKERDMLSKDYKIAYTTVLKALQRDNRFEKADKGIFRLVPDRKETK